MLHKADGFRLKCKYLGYKSLYFKGTKQGWTVTKYIFENMYFTWIYFFDELKKKKKSKMR